MEPWEIAAQAQQQPQQAAMEPWDMAKAAQPQSTGDKLVNDLSTAVKTGHDIENSNLNPIVKPLAYVGQVGANLANNAISDVTPQIVKDALGGAVGLVQKGASYLPGMGSYNTAMQQGIIDPATQAYNNANPNVKALVQSGGEVGKLAGNIAGVDQAATLARAGVNAASDAAGSVIDAVKPAPITTSDQVFGEASKAYKAADAANATLKPEATNAFIKQANLDAGQNAASVKMSGNDAVNQLLKGNGEDTGINSFLNQPLSLQDAHAMDKDLGDAITSNLRSGNDALAMRLGKVQAALRDNLMTPDPANINGGAEGFRAWSEGNRLWSQASRLSDVEDIFKNAAGADVPATAIKNGAKALLKKVNASGGRGWTDDQIAALTTASQTGALTGAMKVLGSRLGGIAGGAIGAGTGSAIGSIPGAIIGGVAGNVTGNLVGAPFRAAATALQSGKVNDVLRAIVDNPTFSPAQKLDALNNIMRK